MTEQCAVGEAPEESRRDQVVAWSMVAIQFALIALIVLVPGGDAWTVPAWLDALGAFAMFAGVAVMVIGALRLGRGLTPTPLPNACARLQTTGLYRFVRHPIYSGLLLFALARTAVSADWVHVVLCALLIALLTVKARWEEQRLAARFPDYGAYAARTPRFVPRPRPAR